MENLVQLRDGTKAYGSKTLFDRASFAVNAQEHVGVIGPNGAGKTTLFRALIGDESLDSGEIIRSRQLKLGYLSQHDDWNAEETIEQFVSREAALPIWELKSLGRSLGLSEDLYSRPVVSFSGGYRMRAKLLRLIGQQPNLMLLDEPTNYLDLETLLVLEKFLQSFTGAFLLISHDREFLRRTTDHVLEVEAGEITKFAGTIDDYFEQKELLRQQLEARALSLDEKRRQILDFVARFGAKATKASQAQSRLKSLDRMETIQTKTLPVSAKIRIPAPARTGKAVLQLNELRLGYAEKTVLGHVQLQLARGEHLAVVGLNGAGKSTLLKAIAGRLAPLSGSLEYGYEVTLAYFHQHVAEELDPADTVLRSLQRKAHSAVLPQEILDLAGSLLFSGDDVHKPIRVLSGGERSRVALGQVLLQKASCLVLDEPTNHLDFETVEALTQALSAFEGALVVVSHDRGFIRRIATKILEVENGRAGAYPGTYDDYVWSLEKGAFATLRSSGRPDERSSKERAETPPLPSANYKERRKSLDKRIRQLDSRLNVLDAKAREAQAQVDLLSAELSSAENASSRHVQETGEKIRELQRVIDESESEWLTVAEEREGVLRELSELIGAPQ